MRSPELSVLPRGQNLTKLSKDDRGSILMLGLPMAVFLVGIIYYLTGIGDAVLHREAMQDAADAAALSAAVLHARGMNFIVLINLVMVALVAILLIFNVVLSLIRMALVALSVASFFTFGSTAGLAAALSELERTMNETYDTVEPAIMTSLGELHRLSSVVRKVVPHVSQLLALEEVARHHDNPAKFGFIVPGRTTLPVEPGRYSVLCGRAAKNISAFLTKPLPNAARELVSDIATDVATTASEWLCGDGDAEAPSYSRETTRWYPSLPQYEACIDPGEAPTRQAIEDCEALRKIQSEAAPDEQGDCTQTTDCSSHGPYEQLLEQARKQCLPREKTELGGYVWQQKTVTETLTWIGSSWSSTEKSLSRGRVLPSGSLPAHGAMGRDSAPCGSNSDAVGSEWNVVVHPNDGSPDVLPVCSEDYTAQLPTDPLEGETVVVRYEVVTQILACQEKLRIAIPIGAEGAKPVGTEGPGKEPYRIAEGASLGGDDFQIRAMAVGNKPTPVPMNVMKITSWGHCAGSDCDNEFAKPMELARFGMAQAEYYYDHSGNEPRSEWMWNMKWRARLVKLRAPEQNPKRTDIDTPGKVATTPSSACRLGAPAAACERVEWIWDQLSSMALH